MSKLTLAIPSTGEKVTIAEPKVDTAFQKVEEWANGKVGTENIEAGTVTETMLSTGVQEKLTTKVGLTLVKQAGSTTGEAEKLYLMETNGTTLTLPAATLNRVVGVNCLNGIASCKMKVAAGKIFGDYLTAAGVTEVTLLENQHILVEADGTNWRVIAGEAKREQTYSAEKSYSTAEAETGVEPSASRPAHVVLNFKLLSSGTVRASVGAVQVLEQTEVTKSTIALFVPPGVKWKVQQGSGTIVESHILL